MSANRVLYIAYPLLTVSEESAGGAEQVLWTLEREMAQRDTFTTVAASAGSHVTGELFSTGEPCSQADDFERRNREHQDTIVKFIHETWRQGCGFDLIHDMSGSFWARAAEIDVPVLATLHLPRHFYPARQFESVPGNVSFNCVSQTQARSFADIKRVIGVVQNGIALDRFRPNHAEHHGLLWLGRVCEEKGPHLALEIAQRSGLPIVMAGQVYPFSYHQQFFAREVEPRLRENPNATWIERPSDELKRKLLRESAVLLITSQVDETSSLVAMEAAASGTPVVAFRRGALAEVVKHGITGLLVNDGEEAEAAIKQIHQLSSVQCASCARAHFNSARMADEYERIYASLAAREELSKTA